MSGEGGPAAAAGAPARPAAPSRGLGAGFGRLWFSFSISNLADGVLFVALPLIAAGLTADPLLVAGVLAARYLPWLLLGIPAGVVADRLPRRTAMVLSGAVRAAVALAFGLLLVSGHATIAALYAATVLLVAAETFHDSAARAIVPEIVPRTRLDRANGRLEGTRVVVEDFGGAPLAGVLFALLAAAPMLANAGAYALAALAVLALPRPAARPAAGAAPRSFGGDLAEGLRYALRHRVLCGLMAAGSLLGVVFTMGMAVLVLFAQQVLGVPPAGYGLFLACTALGALAGSLVASRLTGRWGRGPVTAAAVLLTGASVAAAGLSTHMAVAAVLLAASAFGVTLFNVAQQSVLQLLVPNALLGRVIGLRRTLGWGLMPLGALAGGWLGRIELWLPLVAGGLAAVALALAFIPVWLRADRLVAARAVD